MALYTFFDEPWYSVNEVDRLLDDALRPFTRGTRNNGAGFPTGGQQDSQLQRREGTTTSAGGFQPKMDIRESNDGTVTATFELPGLKKEDVLIDMNKNRLIVSGQTNFENDKEENGWVIKERRRGRFSRSIPLPEGTKPDVIKAGMENGVLSVTFPKTAPESETQKITIN